MIYPVVAYLFDQWSETVSGGCGINPTVGTRDRCAMRSQGTWRAPVASRGGLLPARKGGKGKLETLRGGGLGGALIRRNVVSTWDSGVSRSTGTPRGKICGKHKSLYFVGIECL